LIIIELKQHDNPFYSFNHSFAPHIRKEKGILFNEPFNNVDFQVFKLLKYNENIYSFTFRYLHLQIKIKERQIENGSDYTTCIFISVYH